METTCKNTQPPAIWETDDDKKLEIKQLKKKYTKYAYRHFIKETPLVLLNQNTQWKIEVTTRVIREWWRKSRTRPRIIAIQLLVIMIETAIMGIPASPFGCTDLNITVSRLPPTHIIV